VPIERSRPELRAVPGAPPWWLVGLAALILLLTTLQVAYHGVLVDLDEAISRRAKDWDLRGSWAKPFVYLLTLPGQRGTVLILTGITVGYLCWRTRSVEAALRWLVALVALTVVVYAVKAGVARQAPSAIAGRHNPTDSYPSGHVANAVLVWGTVAWCAARADVARWLVTSLRVIAVGGPVAVIVGMTLLDYHWATDFVAGLCIGIILLPLSLAPWWAGVAGRINRRTPSMRS
jgi:membrane-associated phospholipid phosphatase